MSQLPTIRAIVAVTVVIVCSIIAWLVTTAVLMNVELVNSIQETVESGFASLTSDPMRVHELAFMVTLTLPCCVLGLLLAAAARRLIHKRLTPTVVRQPVVRERKLLIGLAAVGAGELYTLLMAPTLRSIMRSDFGSTFDILLKPIYAAASAASGTDGQLGDDVGMITFWFGAAASIVCGIVWWATVSWLERRAINSSADVAPVGPAGA